jgi:UDP-2,4-diacetamido-2,4,6-trideoxy-beta-L-altropyranose hydrolase
MNIIIRTICNKKIGSGHLMRSIFLANFLSKKNFNVNIVADKYSKFYRDIINTEIINKKKVKYYYSFSDEINSDIVESKKKKKFENFINTKKISHFIIDHNKTRFSIEKLISKLGCSITVIEDLPLKKHKCDTIINPNFRHKSLSRYKNLIPKSSNIFIGPEFIFLKEKYSKLKKFYIKKNIKNCLIYIGSNDKFNVCEKILKHLIKYTNWSFSIILGLNHPFEEKIIIEYSNNLRCNIKKIVSNMDEFLYQSDIVYGTCGISQWERSIVGIPTVLICNAHNQYEDSLILLEKKCTFFLGNSNSLTANKISNSVEYMKDQLTRKKISKNSQKIFTNHSRIKRKLINEIFK